MSKFSFKITKKLPATLARAGEIHTPHGVILTPSFVTVGTKATVKALTPEQVRDLGAQVVLANTYHLYLEPGDEIVAKHGGFPNMMNWHGPTMTDSGGFQVFSLGTAFDQKVSKLAKVEQITEATPFAISEKALAKIDEDGVTFKSYKDGSSHRFTPERSMEIQWNLGADIIFAFDECTSPMAPLDYQKQAMDRTHRWALRSLVAHNELDQEKKQALFGVVQGGRFEELRKESARVLAEMRVPPSPGEGGQEDGLVDDNGFDGFGIGGSFEKDDLGTAVKWVNEILPEGKPRHLLGIGEPIDFFLGVENGCDTFDCVAPTRIARNGGLYTHDGKINIHNAEHKQSMEPIEKSCGCSTCRNYTRAYLAHLFRSEEMLGATLASIHNLYFINKLVADIRQSLLDDTFFEFKDSFLKRYYRGKSDPE
jgi:queuine tRNA-ribosyltransferase